MIKGIVSNGKIPIKLWLDDIESGAMQQAENLSNLPFAYHHIAIMPDAHQGYGMPIGGVMATKGVIVSNAVGVDIGCGICATKTKIKEWDTDKIKEVRGEIRKVIPVGFNGLDHPLYDEMPPINEGLEGFKYDFAKICKREYNAAAKQIGTLGSGNHFIELQKDSEGSLWVMLHSGSRHLGKMVCDEYNKIANNLNEKFFSTVPSNWQLAFLPIESNEGQAYMQEMDYCLKYAMINRFRMMKLIMGVLQDKFNIQGGGTILGDYGFEAPKDNGILNIHHNYAAMESHFGENVLVHRKGATRVREGEIGIIPGSQGTASYIVRGLGNPESFYSCSHGAGRKMSRTKAKATLNLQKEIANMDAQGIVHGMRNQNDLDEASGSYKDISVVMENQKDLVEMLVELKPIGVIKE